MALVDTVTLHRFRDDLREHFSYEACEELFNYYNELSDSTGGDIEFYPNDVAMEWSEFTTFQSMVDEYGNLLEKSLDLSLYENFDELDDDWEGEDGSTRDGLVDTFVSLLQAHTQVIACEGGSFLVNTEF